MQKIILGTYKCVFTNSDIIPEFELVNVENNLQSNAQVVVWSNEYPFTKKELARFPDLKLFINWGTNDSNIKVKNLMSARGVEIKYVDYYATETLAEYTLSLLLLYERNLLELALGNKMKGRELYGKSVGIIGLGRIGYKIGEMLSASFKCNISYLATKDKHLHNFTHKSLSKLLSESDYLIVTIRDDSFVLTLSDLKKANKDLLIVNVTNELVIPTKTAALAIKRGYIRGYIADLKTVKHTKESEPGSILIPKAGYFTDEAKAIKKYILQMMLKKYASAKLSKPNSIYIIRHGITDWNIKGLFQGTLDSELTAQGKKHAKDVAMFLKSKKISVIYSSPLGRSLNTAKIISKIINVPIKIIPEFHEINIGMFQGQTADEMARVFPEYFKLRSENKFIKLYRGYPNGESYYDVYLRALTPMLKIAAEHDNFAVVGHEGINRILRGIINEKKPLENLYYRQKNNEIISINFMSGKEEISII